MGRNGAGKSTLLRVRRGAGPSRRAGGSSAAGGWRCCCRTRATTSSHERVARGARAATLARGGPRPPGRPPSARPLRRRAPAARARRSCCGGEPPAVGLPRRADTRHGPRAQAALAERLASSRPGARRCSSPRTTPSSPPPGAGAHGAARRRAGGRRRPDRRGARRRLVLRDADRPRSSAARAARCCPRSGAARAARRLAEPVSRVSWVARLVRCCSAPRWSLGFAWYERTHPSARVLALVATLAALAALGRVAFAPIPNVKPTTDIVLHRRLRARRRARVRGRRRGRAGVQRLLRAGAVDAVADGRAGAASAPAARCWRASAGRELGRVPLAVACAVAGLAFGAVMNFSLWVTFGGDHTLAKLGGYFVTSLPFDVAHAVGNVAVLPRLRAGARARAARASARASRSTGGPAPARRGTLVALLARACPVRRAAPTPPRAVGALAGQARRTPTAASAARRASARRSCYTGWAALGLAAAGRNPRDVGAAARASSTTCARTRASSTTSASSSARSSLLRGRGRRRRAGRRPRPRRRARSRSSAGDGSFAGRVNTTSFAILGAARRRALAERIRAVRARGAAGSRARRTPTAASTSPARGGAVGHRRHGRRGAGARRGGPARARDACAARPRSSCARAERRRRLPAAARAARRTRSRPPGRCRA